MYENKYLKYKKKYLNLKKNIGGNRTFTIYTTGLSNWLLFLDNNSDTSQNLINIWNDGVRDSIINLVPNKYVKINIIHYDPLLYFLNHVQKKAEGDIKNMAINYISENLIVKDYSNKRVNESKFINDYFNFENLNKPYIILDIGHVFSYPLKLNTVKILNNNNNNNNIELNLNSVRFGFLADPFSISMTKSEIFRINDDGKIITYIDKIIELKEKAFKQNYNEWSPSDTIAKIIENIKKNVENYVKKIKGSKLFLYQINHIIDEVIDNDEIVKSIINYIWNNFSFDEIIEKLSIYIIQKNVQKIQEMEIKNA